MSLLTPELAAREGETVSYTAPEPIGAAAIRYYARAIGATTPAGVAPPTMIFETNQYLDREPDAHGFAGHSWGIEVPDTRLIRGGNRFAFHQPVVADTVPTMTWRIGSMTERTSRDGRAMLIVESTAECHDQAEVLLAETTETLIWQSLGNAQTVQEEPPPLPPSSVGRGRPPGRVGVPSGNSLLAEQASPLRGDPSPRADESAVHRTITLTDMVRYAGATWDWHQLHYDPDHLASVGLGRPVVDGQMLGAFMAEDLGRHGAVRTLRYRFTSMVFAGETVVVETTPDGEGAFSQVVRVDDRVCVTGGGTVDA